MQNYLEARIENLTSRLNELQSRHAELTRELQSVSNEYVRTRGALEEAGCHLEELARLRSEHETGGEA
ncbi:MAG: hypothetical protein A3F83_06075 [Candidatus Glassbacteria bacterium RIFCSPLOWO2_12_FULL_58_11]|uniref:Uncharacterized protein n=2 Tax=Candidatus Glassiibacteriota TaxID=1817805 RepID=A0A1F5YM98_9BACT|nr:MAG: hypothetical protein A2Z86_01490 [Candidatus Glassbacteria bacterium GWA2_58_10]OGG01276.1 MAG: hypothetical protein A3F83_06075 [Candidatus Glassbacteria bacterium RIFCSPLOWO2_12_FULL_58_11]